MPVSTNIIPQEDLVQLIHASSTSTSCIVHVQRPEGPAAYIRNKKGARIDVRQISCHQCKVKKDKHLFVHCHTKKQLAVFGQSLDFSGTKFDPTSKQKNSNGRRIKPKKIASLCVKSYCTICIEKHYHIKLEEMTITEKMAFICPACRHECTCAGCRFKRTEPIAIPIKRLITAQQTHHPAYMTYLSSHHQDTHVDVDVDLDVDGSSSEEEEDQEDQCEGSQQLQQLHQHQHQHQHQQQDQVHPLVQSPNLHDIVQSFEMFSHHPHDSSSQELLHSTISTMSYDTICMLCDIIHPEMMKSVLLSYITHMHTSTSSYPYPPSQPSHINMTLSSDTTPKPISKLQQRRAIGLAIKTKDITSSSSSSSKKRSADMAALICPSTYIPTEPHSAYPYGYEYESHSAHSFHDDHDLSSHKKYKRESRVISIDEIQRIQQEWKKNGIFHVTSPHIIPIEPQTARPAGKKRAKQTRRVKKIEKRQVQTPIPLHIQSHVQVQQQSHVQVQQQPQTLPPQVQAQIEPPPTDPSISKVEPPPSTPYHLSPSDDMSHDLLPISSPFTSHRHNIPPTFHTLTHRYSPTNSPFTSLRTLPTTTNVSMNLGSLSSSSSLFNTPAFQPRGLSMTSTSSHPLSPTTYFKSPAPLQQRRMSMKQDDISSPSSSDHILYPITPITPSFLTPMTISRTIELSAM